MNPLIKLKYLRLIKTYSHFKDAFAAMDMDGEIYIYSKEPAYKNGRWDFVTACKLLAYAGKINDITEEDSRNSLTKLKTQ
jgi:hypothetical protein